MSSKRWLVSAVACVGVVLLVLVRSGAIGRQPDGRAQEEAASSRSGADPATLQTPGPAAHQVSPREPAALLASLPEEPAERVRVRGRIVDREDRPVSGAEVLGAKDRKSVV